MRRIEDRRMDCSGIRGWLFRRLDDELSLREREELDAHLLICPACTREWRLLSLPRLIGRSIPALEPSPYFYARLKTRLEREKQSVTIWQLLLGLSRQIVPAMATITLVILSLFAYYEFRGPRMDLYQAYDSIFMSGDRQSRMVIADEVTEESVLRALAEKPLNPGTHAARK
jgi:hypothetical protein